MSCFRVDSSPGPSPSRKEPAPAQAQPRSLFDWSSPGVPACPACPAQHSHSSGATSPWLSSRYSQAQHSEMIGITASREHKKLPLTSLRLQSDSEPSPQQAQELSINSSTALTSRDSTQHIPIKPVTIFNAWSPTAGTKKDSCGLLHTKAKQNKGLIPTSHGQGGAQACPGQPGSIMVTGTWADNCHHSHTSSFFPGFTLWFGMSLGSAVLSCPHCVPPQLLVLEQNSPGCASPAL